MPGQAQRMLTGMSKIRMTMKEGERNKLLQAMERQSNPMEILKKKPQRAGTVNTVQLKPRMSSSSEAKVIQERIHTFVSYKAKDATITEMTNSD